MAEDMNNELEEGFELDEEEVIVLEDGDGNEVKFNHIATLDYKDDWYILLQPVELGDLEEDEMIIFRIESDENGDDVYVPLEDEEEMNAVYEEYVKLAEEDECDCEECGCEDCDCDHEHDDHCDCGCHKDKE